MFNHIHCHSEYSALDGLSTCKEIAKRAKDIGCEAVGLSDHGVVAGHLDFSKACIEEGIKPIFAVESYHGVHSTSHTWERNQRDQAHLLIGALTDKGLGNLWKLSSLSARNFRFVGRVDWEMLAEHNEGLFCTSACVQGLVSKELQEDNYSSLEKYLSIFGDRFYIELHTYPTETQRLINKTLVQIAQEKGLPVIFACDAHFDRPERYPVHDAYLAMSTGDTLDTPIELRKMWHPKALYMQTEDEVRENLSYLPSRVVDEALRTSVTLTDSCNAELPEVRRHLPVFVPSECPWLENKDRSAKEVLLDLVKEGISQKFEDPEPAFEQALEEYDVFSKGNLEHYLLMTWDLVQFCKENKITIGPGRGSGAASVLNYALGITMLDPLKYNLYFERFYNAGREKGFPDIDLDFPTNKREEVRKYLADRWGKDRVRSIGNVNRMKPKKALDQSYKVCGVSFDEWNAVKKMLDQVPDLDILTVGHFGWDRESSPGKDTYVMDHIGRGLDEWLEILPEGRQQVVRNWLALVSVICGRVFTYGVHASGVVISDIDLDDQLPCALRGSEDKKKQKVKILATQFPMADVEKLMFVKEDVLGLRNLDTLDEWVRLMNLEDFDWEEIDEAEVDGRMWNLFDKGFTLGIFQIEDSATARDLCRSLQPRSIYDLGVIVALNRPGPLRSGATQSYVLRKQGKEPVTYDHALLEPILKDTYGVIVFQEQIIRFFQELGYSKQQADNVRAILGKKKLKDMDNLLNGKGEWEGISYPSMAYPKVGEKVAKLLWEKLMEYSRYSFNAPHALSYGALAFRTSLAKFYGTEEFTIALITTNPDEAGKYITEASRMGIEVKPPDILRSDLVTTRVDNEILYGLSNIKWVKNSAKILLKWREEYDISSPEKLADVVEAEQKIWEENKVGVSPRTLIKRSVIDHLTNAGAFDPYSHREISMRKRQQYEEQYLGIVLSDDSEEIFEKYLTLETNSDRICLSYEEAEDQERTIIPGIVTDIYKTKTRNSGMEMAILTLSYKLSQLRVAVFPDHWLKYQSQISKGILGFFSIKKSARGHSLQGAKFFS